MVFEFARDVKPDLSNYDPEGDAACSLSLIALSGLMNVLLRSVAWYH